MKKRTRRIFIRVRRFLIQRKRMKKRTPWIRKRVRRTLIRFGCMGRNLRYLIQFLLDRTKVHAYLIGFHLYRTKVAAYLIWFLLYRTKVAAYLIQLGKRGNELGSYLIGLGKHGNKKGSYGIRCAGYCTRQQSPHHARISLAARLFAHEEIAQGAPMQGADGGSLETGVALQAQSRGL